MKQFLILVLLFLTILTNQSYALEELRVVATIDDQAITSRYISDKIALYKLFMGGQEISQEKLYKLALQNSIDDFIIQSHYKHFLIPESAIQELINKLLLENKMQLRDLETVLMKHNLTIEHLKDYFRNQMLLSNFVLEDLYSKSDKRELFEKDFMQSQVVQHKIELNNQEANRILVAKNFNKESQVLFTEISVKRPDSKIIQKILQGIDFVQIQKEYPDQVELQGVGGSLGWMTFGDLSEPYQETIRMTQVGAISQPIVGENLVIFLKILSLKGVKEKEYQQNPHYLLLPKDKKLNFELQKTLGEHYSNYRLKNLRTEHYIAILD